MHVEQWVWLSLQVWAFVLMVVLPLVARSRQECRCDCCKHGREDRWSE